MRTIAVAVTVALSLSMPALADDTTPSGDRIEATIAPVLQAYASVRMAQAKMPPPKDVSEQLTRLRDLDQAGRTGIQHINLDGLSKAEADTAVGAINREIDAQDRVDQATLESLIPTEGWFRISVYGKEATAAAFLIVQHAVADPVLMRTTLEKMETLLPEGEVRDEYYALLYDRVSLMFDHKLQRYGSQIQCIDGRPGPENVEDPANLDARRKGMGMDTEAEYLKGFPSTCPSAPSNGAK